MRAEVRLDEDTTTLYVRWEIVPEGKEPLRLAALGGPLTLQIAATDYVNTGGKDFATADVEIPIAPHAGERNFGQARFRTHEARRGFVESLQESVIDQVTTFVLDGDVASVPLEGHAIRVGYADTPTS